MLVAVTGGTADDARISLVRYLPSGSLDSHFGEVQVRAAGNEAALAFAMQSDGKIVVAGGGGQATPVSGTAGMDIALLRLMPDGALDAIFGNEGRLTTAIKVHAGTGIIAGMFNKVIDPASAFAALPTGKAVLAGHIDYHFAATQFTTSGLLVSRIGNSGRFAFTVAPGWHKARAL